MSVITNIESWGNSHRPGWLDIVRILLGAFITFKGIEFMANMDWLTKVVGDSTQVFAGASVAHYVVFAHLLGGPLIVVGSFTRAMCAIQLPILLGAIILVNAPKGFLSVGNHMELEVSIVVLLGIVALMIFGAGKFSIDEKRRHDKIIAQR
ncbi:MAG TPA: DoxX family protein [Cyclobacteriaceae bacterium]